MRALYSSKTKPENRTKLHDPTDEFDPTKLNGSPMATSLSDSKNFENNKPSIISRLLTRLNLKSRRHSSKVLNRRKNELERSNHQGNVANDDVKKNGIF